MRERRKVKGTKTYLRYNETSVEFSTGATLALLLKKPSDEIKMEIMGWACT
jgi:hypothetical protein